MALSDYFKSESKYLRADDVPDGAELRLAIERVVVETIENNDSSETKAVCYFKGKEKGLILNATNGRCLVEAYGDSPEACQGRDIVLYRTRVDFKGQMVGALRIRIPTTEVGADEVPF